MEGEVKETRKQFIKLAEKAKEARKKAKEAWQVSGYAAREVNEQKEHVKELQIMCKELAENIV